MTRPSFSRGIVASLFGIFRRREPPGGPQTELARDMGEIAAYHRSLRQAPDAVDDRTWADLDMDAVFAKVDGAATILGRQVLYHQMRQYEGSGVLAERARQQELFQEQPRLREAVRSQLRLLDRPGSRWLAQLILEEAPSVPRHAWALVPLSVSCLVCLVAIPVYHPILLLAFALIFVNATIHVRYGQQITPYFQGFSQISSMLGVGRRLAETPGGESLPQIQALGRTQPAADRLRRQFGWLVVDRSALPDLCSSLIEYLNVFFLLDLIVFIRSLATLRRSQPLLLEIFGAIGSLDAAIAASGYWLSLSPRTRPRIADARELSAAGIYHPLIPNAVGGSISLTDRSAVIAGPNMAGKTTFIRTVAINLILSRTLNICLASSAVLPRASVHSSIKREDALLDGQSYFFAELDQILGFVKQADRPELCLFLVDEPFRGTNTVERIASSSSVLRHLARRQLVLASTHDGELQQLLGDSFDMFHFRDQVVDGVYGFDYVIRPGPAQSRNAIRLLELRGYPAPVVAEAERIAAGLSPPKPPASPCG